MAPLLNTPLEAAPFHLDRPAVIEARRIWTWREVHAASLVLARRIEGATAVCNLCTSRLGFLVTCVAALRNRCLLVLPPSGSSADHAAVLEEAGSRPVVVGDPEAWPEPCCDPRTGAGTYLSCRPERQTAEASALAWEPAWDDVAVRLYTSGSTGMPQPQPKTLRHLVRGAQALANRLEKEIDGGVAALRRIVCSVPPQHMFGLEASVMLPLTCGMPVLDRRPLLPADIRAAFAGGPPGAWIATPMHLRNLVESFESVPACRVVIASTMPLSPAVARRSETLVHAPVLEIYGSTETGALAMRRTAQESGWRPLDDVRLELTSEATLAHGSHFASPATLLDEIEHEAAGSFTLLGRHNDLIKIAGRRASLAGLNLLLQELPGLEDGVFYLPATGNPTERLCLIYSGPPLGRAATRRWLRARLDAVFLPRAFIRIERLPRGENGKLRKQMLDRVYAEWQSAVPTRLGAVGSPVSEQVGLLVTR